MTSEGDFQDYQDYLANFENRILDCRQGLDPDDDVIPLTARAPAFTTIFKETLEDLGQLPELEIAHIHKPYGRSRAVAHGYAISELESRIDLAIALEADDNEDTRVPPSDLRRAYKQAVNVFRLARDGVYEEMEPSSDEYNMMELMHQAHAETHALRILVFISGSGPEPAKIPDFEQPDDLPEVQVDVWDMKRLFRADTSGLSYESIPIDMEELLGGPLFCLPGPNTANDHRCYLAIFPGDLLHDLYHKHGPRLLELNVRSFLQARGKVNKGIRDTIQEKPEYFLAYNNGISVTAEDLDIVKNTNGSLGIKTMKGLQIVNGGQTVASIHRARNRDGADLSKVWVQAKITVVEGKSQDELVPHISRYSNTQNRVSEIDLTSNHPFHVRMQQLSAQIWCPGETDKWTYERARGQWEVARTREGSKEGSISRAELRKFDLRTPKAKKVDKTLLALALNAWDEIPHVACLGGQKNFLQFMDRLFGTNPDWLPDEDYYKEAISKVIILKMAQRISRQIKFPGYRSETERYTVALLAFKTSGRVDLTKIWEEQGVSDALEETLRRWMPLVRDEIIDSAGDLNVREWAKKKECWGTIMALPLEFAPGLEEELLPLSDSDADESEQKTVQAQPLSVEERDRQAKVMGLDHADWEKLVKWGAETASLDAKQLEVAAAMLSYAVQGWRQVPSPEQTAQMTEPIKLWEERDTTHED